MLPSVCLAYAGYWRMEGASTDISGNGNNGADTSVTYGTNYGKIGQGANGNNTTSKINFGQATSTKINGDLTISMWIYFTSANNVMYTFSRTSSVSPYGMYNVQYYRDAAQMTLLIFNTAGGSYFCTDNSVLTGKWYYFTANISGTTITCYKNGIISTSTGTFIGTRSNLNISTAAFCRSNDCNSPTSGNVDEIILDNTVWTSQKVKTMYSYYRGIF